MAIAATGQLNLDELPSHGSRTVDCFQKLEQIGEGTYAQVYKAKEIETGEIVALKKIRMENEKEGFPITAIREIKILQKLHHENVVKLKEIVASPGSEKDEQGRPGGIYMVFEYMDHDLAGLLRCSATFSVPQIKCYLRQLLMGLHYCHVNQVLHRDIKGANLLIDNNGILKLADFGLARFFANEHNGSLTNRVITLWYRPPELLMGSTKYGPAVDMWSVGCIFAELLVGKPLFPGKDESEQIFKIFELCGAPDESTWPGVRKLPWYENFKPNRPLKRRLREHLRLVDRHALELLEKMLVLDPSKRISTLAALDAEYFWTDPLPCDPQSLPKYESSHEFQTKQKRQYHGHHEEAGKRPKFQHLPTQTRVTPMQQFAQAQAHSQRHTGSYQQKRRHEEVVKYEKVHPSAHSPSHANARGHGRPNQQQIQDEEAAKHQKLQHPISHIRPLPNQQAGQAHSQWQAAGPNQPMHGSQAFSTSGSGHHYGNPQGQSRYSQGVNSGGRNRPTYGSHGGWRGYDGASYGHGPNGVRGPGHQGGGSDGFESARNYHQNGFYIGSSVGRGSNMKSRRHNHQYGSR